MHVHQQVETAISTAASLASPVFGEARLQYALGWIVANSIVAAHYHHDAIDALPVYHPEHGWDRFLLTRRVSCQQLQAEPADAFGRIMLTGDDAPLLVNHDGTVVHALGPLLSTDPARAIAQVQSFIPVIGLVPGDHLSCWHERAVVYPLLYSVITDLILQYPGLIATREVFVDDGQTDGMFHPLFIHTGGRGPAITYDWFALQTAEYIAYVQIAGAQAIYLRDDGNWSTVRKQFDAEDREGMTRRILALLRLEGTPDEATHD